MPIGPEATGREVLAGDGVVTKESQRSVADTVQRLGEMVSARGMKVFAVIDQQGEARAHGLDLRDTVVVIFGSPEAGTPVMASAPLSRARSAPQGPGLGRRRSDEDQLHGARHSGHPVPPEQMRWPNAWPASTP